MEKLKFRDGQSYLEIMHTIYHNLIYFLLKDTRSNEEDVELSKIFSRLNKSVLKHYDILSDIIFQLSNDDFDKIKYVFGVGENVDYPYQKFIASITVPGFDTTEIEGFERHIKLACHQRNLIFKAAVEAKDLAGEARKISEEAYDIKNKIYSEFISILAIFTAVSFAMMGSVQVLGNLFSQISTPSINSIGYALIVSGIYLISMLLLIETLFIGMKKVVKNTEKYKFSIIFWITLVVSVNLILSGIFVMIFFE